MDQLLDDVSSSVRRGPVRLNQSVSQRQCLAAVTHSLATYAQVNGIVIVGPVPLVELLRSKPFSSVSREVRSRYFPVMSLGLVGA